jgi:DNA-binding transcriptional LysR family regulator
LEANRINIEKIKYYIDLVDCRSFTETAKRNYVSQTTISQTVAALEDTFQSKLINRKKTPIEPTEAGQLFYDEAVVLWKQYEGMQKKMRNFQANQVGSLSIEYSAMTDIQTLLSVIPAFRKEYPLIELNLNKVLLKNIADYLRKGIYDVAVAFDSEFEGKKDIATVPLYAGSYQAVVGAGHPLFGKEIVTLAELYRYPLVMLDPAVIGASYDLILQHAHKDGFQPQIAKTVDDVETELFAIRTENLIGLFPDNYNLNYPSNEIRMIPIEGSFHTFEIALGYLSANAKPAIQALIRSIKAHYSISE